MPSDPHVLQNVAWLVVALAFLFIAANAGIKFFRAIKDQPPPAEVLSEARRSFATIESLKAIEARVSAAANKAELESHVARAREDHAAIYAQMRSDTERMEARLDDVFGQMQASITAELRRLEASGDASRAKLHERINPLERQLGEVLGSLRGLTSRTEQVELRIETLPDRIIAILKTTGALK